MTSARMKPRSKSVWIAPAACGAVAPTRTVQARTSFGPAVKIGLQAQQPVGAADHAVQSRLAQAELGQEFAALGLVQLRDLRLDGRAHRHHHRPVRGGALLAPPLSSGLLLKPFSATLATYMTGFAVSSCSSRTSRCSSGVSFSAAHRLHGIQLHLDALEQRALARWRPCRRSWRPWRRARGPSRASPVGERQLGVDDIDVRERIDAAGDVDDVACSRSSAPRARSHPPRGCARGTGCPAPRPARRRRPGRRCPRTPPSSGTIFSGCAIAASCSRRGSGTGTTPTFGSMVQNG